MIGYYSYVHQTVILSYSTVIEFAMYTLAVELDIMVN